MNEKDCDLTEWIVYFNDDEEKWNVINCLNCFNSSYIKEKKICKFNLD